MPQAETSVSIKRYFLIATQDSLHSGPHMYVKQALQKYGQKFGRESFWY
jgi:hypothetical protein